MSLASRRRASRNTAGASSGRGSRGKAPAHSRPSGGEFHVRSESANWRSLLCACSPNSADVMALKRYQYQLRVATVSFGKVTAGGTLHLRGNDRLAGQSATRKGLCGGTCHALRANQSRSIFTQPLQGYRSPSAGRSYASHCTELRIPAAPITPLLQVRERA